MVGCLKTCGLLCALLTALHVCCAVDDDYKCYEGKADDTTAVVSLKKCDQAFYRLSFEFSQTEQVDKNKEFLAKHKNVNIDYQIKLKNKQGTSADVTPSTFKGIPVKGRPLDFITKHVPNVVRIEMTVKLTGNDTTGGDYDVWFDISLENHLSGDLFKWKNKDNFRTNFKEKVYVDADKSEMAFLTTPRYPRCLAFVINSATPDVIYAGCVKQMGYDWGSKVCRVREQGLEFTIKTIHPLSDDGKLCPILEKEPPICEKSVIDKAKNSDQFNLVEELRSTTTEATTTESQDPNKNTGATKETGTAGLGQTKDDKDKATAPTTTGSSKETNTEGTAKEATTKEKTITTSTTPKATPPPPPPTTTCKSESDNQIGLIVALVLFVVLMLVAIGVAGFLFLRSRGLEAENKKLKDSQEEKIALKTKELKEEMAAKCKELKETEEKLKQKEIDLAELNVTLDKYEPRDATGKDGDKSKDAEKKKSDSFSVGDAPMYLDDQEAMELGDKPKEEDKPKEGEKPNEAKSEKTQKEEDDKPPATV